MKPWARQLALGLLLSAAIAPAVKAAENAEQVLLAKAHFWQLKDRPDLVRQSLNQLLALNPAQPDALYQYGVLELQGGNAGKAQAYLARLRQAAPGDPRIGTLQAAIAGRAAPAGSGSSVAPPGSADAAPAGAGASASGPTAVGAPLPLQDTATSADSGDLIASPAAAPPPAATASASGAPAAVPGASPAAAGAAAGNGKPVKQVAQLELTLPPPVGGYQPPIENGPVPEQDSLELDIARSMAQIESESAPQLQAGLIYRVRDGQSGTSSLNEVGVPIEGRYSPFLTGKMRITVTPLYLDAGSLGIGSESVFGANPLLLARGLPGVLPGAQNAGGVNATIGYSFGPVSGKIGVSGWGFPVTNLIGNLAYEPRFLNDQLAVRIEGLREPVTDSLLSYAGTHAALGAANAVSGGAFGTNGTWGGVVKTGVRGSVFYDNTDIGAFASFGASFLQGTNVPQNGEREASIGAYFRPYRTENSALRVGVSVLYLGFDKNLSFYTFGQGGYFSPQNYEALTFPVEYQARVGRWSYLGAVALGVQHFNQSSSPFFPNDPFAQQQLAALVGPSSAVYSGSATTSLAADLRAQVEYAIDDSLSVGAAASYDNGHDYNEGIVKVYFRKTFPDPTPVTPILPGTPIPPGTPLPVSR